MPSARAITRSSISAFSNGLSPRITSRTTVTPSSGIRRRTAPSPSSSPRKPRVAVRLLEGLDLLGPGRRAVGVAAGDQLLDDLGVALARARTGRPGRRPSRAPASAAPRRSARRSPGVERSRSVSSIRSTKLARRGPRARSQLYSAVRAPPMWSAPVGDGAKRTRILDTACHEIKASRSDADRRPRLARRRACRTRSRAARSAPAARSSSSTRARAPGGRASTPRRRSPPTTRRSAARRSTRC